MEEMNFPEAIEMLNNSKTIKDKTLICCLFNELSRFLVSNVPNILSNEIRFQVNQCFMDTLVHHFSSDISAKEFIRYVISECFKTRLFVIFDNNQDLLKKFSNNIDAYIEKNRYAITLDECNKIPFTEKVDIMLAIDNLIYNADEHTIKVFGDKRTEDLRKETRITINNGLKRFLNNKLDEVPAEKRASSVVSILKRYLKLSYVRAYEEGYLKLDASFDKDLTDTFHFSKIEKEILTFSQIYKICNLEPVSKFNKEERLEEFCDSLAISKLRYAFALIAMSYHIAKVYRTPEEQLDEALSRYIRQLSR